MKAIIIYSLLLALYACNHSSPNQSTANPIFPGDFADPCLVQHNDTFYIYATAWDSKNAIVWYSSNFIDWKMRHLNWPTAKENPLIWAPNVVKGKDGRFYFYTSSGHEIYAGVANHPLGPFKNMLPDEQPMIRSRQYWDKMHSIDADCFIDDDGKAYLYWGSGWDWKDGLCAVGRLNDDMCSFAEEPQLITPSNYFEAPHMMKRNEVYYLMYSDGICIEDSYKVRYATSDSPMGPFVEASNSPILTNTPDSIAWSPGHHFTAKLGEKDYIIYHTQAIPVYTPFWGPIRQVAIDELTIVQPGKINKVKPTRQGIIPTFAKDQSYHTPHKIIKAQASDSMGAAYGPMRAFDNHNGTLWAAPKGKPASLTADLGEKKIIKQIMPIFDIIDGNYKYTLSTSIDSDRWELYDHRQNENAIEWPVASEKTVEARYIRLEIDGESKEPQRIGVWELKVY